MANINRGEHALTINDTEYTLVLTLDDLETLEGTLEIGALQLFQQLSLRIAQARHVRAILVQACKKATPRPKAKEVPDLLAQVTFQARYAAALALVAGGLNMLEAQQPQDEQDEQDEKEPDSDAEQRGEGGSTPLSEKAG